MSTENWFVLKDFPNYSITKDGVVKNNKRESILGVYDSMGYPSVNLSKNGKHCSVRLHRLIAETFIDNPESKPQVNHKDGNKLNYSISNLEWVTRSENVRHAFENGLHENTKRASSERITIMNKSRTKTKTIKL